jgi:hypothetical protein
MQQKLVILLLAVLAWSSSCTKESNANADCFPEAPTVRQITNKQARVILAGGQFYIVEQATIDTRLHPCNLADSFRVNNLQVTISGDVKSTVQGGPGPCCMENFVITSISR